MSVVTDENNKDLTPSQIVEKLDQYIIGQNKAKKAVAVALRNRIRRLKLPEEIRDEVAPKNILMIGSTGVGKTEIARRLAKLCKAPFLKVEATKYTEVGYVGRGVGVAQRAPRVLDRGLRRHGAERYDLRDRNIGRRIAELRAAVGVLAAERLVELLIAVMVVIEVDLRVEGLGLVRLDLVNVDRSVVLLDMPDDVAAPCLAHVDVEVRHRDSLRVQEALEKEVEAQRIKIGDLNAVGDERSGARAASGAYRNAVVL